MKRGRSLESVNADSAGNDAARSSKSKKKGKQAVKCSTKQINSCYKCHTTCQSGLKCDYCDSWVHHSCCGLSEGVLEYDAISKVISVFGWTCNDCKVKIKRLLTSLTTETNDITEIRDDINKLKNDINAGKKSSAGPTQVEMVINPNDWSAVGLGFRSVGKLASRLTTV